MDSDNFILRPARISDLTALFELENTCFTADRMSFTSFRRLLKVKSASFLVVTANKKIVASTLLFFRKNSQIVRVYSLAVHPDFRKAGLASKLFDYADTFALQKGCKEIRLEVSEKNSGAISLYLKKGYIKFGEKIDYYEDHSTAFLFKKNLKK